MTAGSVTLVGAGHAHLHIVRQAARLRAAGLTVTLIAPELFQYSGLASGVLSGALALDETQLDVAALAAAFGVRYLPQSVVAVDRAARTLTLADGATETYEQLSLNIGSVAADPYGLVDGPGVWPVKPLWRLLTLRTQIEAQAAAGGPAPRIVVAGGGHSALEIAASLCGLVERGNGRPQVTVIAPSTGKVFRRPPGPACRGPG